MTRHEARSARATLISDWGTPTKRVSATAAPWAWDVLWRVLPMRAGHAHQPRLEPSGELGAPFGDVLPLLPAHRPDAMTGKDPDEAWDWWRHTPYFGRWGHRLEVFRNGNIPRSYGTVGA
jgi:hypothetical protein